MMIRATIALALTAGLAATSAPPTRVATIELPTAEEIMDQMAKTYATARSYRDTGYTAGTVSGAPLLSKPFSTAFVRPDRYRFEYSQTQFGRTQRNILW